MKIKYLWVILLSLTFFGCDDNTGTLGLGMFPGGDQIVNGKLATFDVTTKSELSGKVFAKTSVGYLGKFTDPEFGYYEAGFLAQLHCNEGLTFPAAYDENDPNNPNAIMVKNEIYRTELALVYSSYFGDSLTASRLSVYQLNKDLDKESAYYTDIKPEDFYDKNNPKSLLGRKAYTAVDLSVASSVRNADGYVPYLNIPLPNTLGQDILKASRESDKNGTNFADVFRNMFKGIYVKNDYGDGTILYIDQIELHVWYECYVKGKDGANLKKSNSEEDSIRYSYRTFAATKEIIQANSFNSDEEKIKEKVEEKEWTYLKTPAGIYTQATLPLLSNNTSDKKGILDSLSNDTLNVVKLVFTNYNQANDNKSQFSMNAPDYILLVREKDKDSFFKENKINDDITSYLAQHNYISSNQYVFPNISRLVNTCKAERAAAVIALQNDGKIEGILDVDNGQPVTTIEAWEKATLWNKIAIIPVTITKDKNTSTASGSIISILNDLKPGYTKLKGGEDSPPLSLEVIYTSFSDDKK